MYPLMKKFMTVAGVIALLLAAGWLVRAVTAVRVNARAGKLSQDVESLFDGLQKYKEYVGAYPVGSNAEVARTLLGQNPTQVISLVGRKLEQNGKGEFVDPWGTPLRFYFSDNSVLIRSAGKNRRFEESTSMDFDDYIRSN